MTNEQLWQAVLGALEIQVSRANFTTWFKKSFIHAIQDKNVVIGVPNTFTQAWLEKKYYKEILIALENASAQNFSRLIFKVGLKPDTASQSMPTAPTNNAFANTEEPEERGLNANGFIPRYVFNNFVVGKGNELAYAACRAAAHKPGTTYNPLFIYGGAGLGKTHLMHAVAHEIMSTNPRQVVRYVTCEKFTNDFVQAVRNGRGKEFMDAYRNIDALLVDDIQFLTGKEGTQEAFFHTFNELHQQNKQIVICSDRPPKAIATLEQRLLTRFEWGLIADVIAPDLETRLAILATKCQEKGLELDENCLEYIASHIQSNVRELEGALNRIVAHYQLNNQKPSLDSIKEVLAVNAKSAGQKGSLTIKQVIITVSNFFDVGQDELMGSSRKKELVVPRQIIMYLLREETNNSFPAIGQAMGGRDHTTAMHAYKKICNCVNADEKIRQDINLIKQRLYN